MTEEIDHIDQQQKKISGRHMALAVLSMVFNGSCLGFFLFIFIPEVINGAFFRVMSDIGNIPDYSIAFLIAMLSTSTGLIGAIKIARAKKNGLVYFTIGNLLWTPVALYTLMDEVNTLNVLALIVPILFTVIFYVPPRPLVITKN